MSLLLEDLLTDASIPCMSCSGECSVLVSINDELRCPKCAALRVRSSNSPAWEADDYESEYRRQYRTPMDGRYQVRDPFSESHGDEGRGY